MVNKLGWPQVGRVSEPGRYMFRFGWLTVTAEDLAVWEQYPNAVFTLVRGRISPGGLRIPRGPLVVREVRRRRPARRALLVGLQIGFGWRGVHGALGHWACEDALIRVLAFDRR